MRSIPALLSPNSQILPDSDRSGVKLSDLVTAAAEDLGQGRANRQQLIDLQNWVRAQQDAQK